MNAHRQATLILTSGGQRDESEDWSFRGSDTKQHIHGIHPYPARMIPQIAERLIANFSTEGELVLDPFCGSGSVLTTAKILRRRSIGCDINPLACLLAKVKTTPLNPLILEDEIRKISIKLHERRRKGEIQPIPEHLHRFNIHYWFKKENLQELLMIKTEIDKIKNGGVRDFFCACFSKTVRDVSLMRGNEYKLYRMPSEEIRKFHPDAVEIFIENARSAIEGMRAFSRICSDAPSLVLLSDARNLPIKDESVDLIVTSPPYGDSQTTVAYGQFSRYSSLLLGFDAEIVKNVDKIGLGGGMSAVMSTAVRAAVRQGGRFESRSELPNSELPHGSQTLEGVLREISKRSKKRAETTLLFFAELAKCISEMRRVLKTEKYACIVIGNRTVSRVKVPTDKIIVEIGANIGFEHVRTYHRKIPTKRIPWENAPENLKGEKGRTISEESIIVLRS